MPTTEELLESIDQKIGALLAIAIDDYLRRTEIAKPKDRSIDQMLTDVGLSAQTISDLLGKTTAAVYLQLKNEREKKSKKTAKAKSK